MPNGWQSWSSWMRSRPASTPDVAPNTGMEPTRGLRAIFDDSSILNLGTADRSWHPTRG